MNRSKDKLPAYSPGSIGEEIATLLTSDPSQAVINVRDLAERGDPQAQLLLGQLLVNGVGVAKDAGEAFHWFRAAARSQIPMAMNMVGRCHEYGLGTPVDYELAARWYHRAATFDCDWAIYNYAHMLANGRGVDKNRADAFIWFKLATSRGHARAMHFLGQYYENGWETPVDRETAFSLYQRSAEGGDYRGQCSYASVLTERGQVKEALRWLESAVKSASAAYLVALGAKLRTSSHPEIREFANKFA